MSVRVRWVGTAVLLAVLVGIAGCAGNGPREYRPGTVHQDPLGVYAIVLPEGWAQDPDYPYDVVFESDYPERDVAFAEQSVLDDPDKDPKYEPGIAVDVEAWGGTLQEAVDRQRGLFAGTDGKGPAVDEPVVLPDGTPAHLLGALYASTTVESLHLVVVNGNTLITVEAYGGGAEWQRYRGLYEAALRSVTTPVDAPEPTGSELSGHPAQPGVPFRDDEGAFTIVPPAGWQIRVLPPETLGDRRIVAFAETDPSGKELSGFGINISAPQDGTSVLDRIEQERGFTATLDYTTDEPTVLGDGTPAHLFVAEDDQRLLVLAMARGDLYEIVARAETAQDWARSRAVMEASIRTLTFS